jgi:hypothetical protein
MVENFCPISTVGDLKNQLLVGAFPRIFGEFSPITGPISHFLQPLTDKANWITSSKAGAHCVKARALARLVSHCDCLKFQSGGIMDPGLRREDEGNIR